MLLQGSNLKADASDRARALAKGMAYEEYLEGRYGGGDGSDSETKTVTVSLSVVLSLLGGVGVAVWCWHKKKKEKDGVGLVCCVKIKEALGCFAWIFCFPCFCCRLCCACLFGKDAKAKAQRDRENMARNNLVAVAPGSQVVPQGAAAPQFVVAGVQPVQPGNPPSGAAGNFGVANVGQLDKGRAVQEANQSLPPGWTAAWSAQRNRVFYRNQGLGKTQWERPSGVAAPPAHAQAMTI